MIYERQEWKDHLVDKLTGEIVQKGTILKAERFEHIENGIVENSLAIEALIKNIEGIESVSVEELDLVLAQVTAKK